MRAVDDVIDRVAATDVTVLVWGETGVGKELVAHALHEQSPRHQAPFVKVNCAALPRELLEGELFGYERGAFTGAHRSKPGKFELAHTGTIFLDEIGEMPLPLQAKLLQVLQDHEFSRLGSRRDLRVDVRVIAATNQDLGQLVAAGGFREDLYYRLNVVSIHVPSLRRRLDQIPFLVDHFLELYAQRYGRPQPVVSSETMRTFMAYGWPGNIRELENVVRRIVVLGSEDWVEQELTDRQSRGGDSRSLPPRAEALRSATLVPVSDASVDPAGSVAETLGLKELARQAARQAERVVMSEVLNQVHWNRVEAARRLKISYKALLYKIKDHGLAN